MLELKIAGEPLDLLPGTTITIDEESPVFDKDTIPGGFSFPFSLPMTARNRRILDFPERIEKSGAMSTEQPFQIFHGGRLRASGTIKVTEAGTDYRAYLKVASGDFAAKVGDKKLNEVDFGGSRTWLNKAEFTQADDFTLFPVLNEDFLDDLPGYTWGTGYRLNHYVSNLFFDEGDESSLENWALSVYPFVSYVVRRIFQDHGFFVDENILGTDPELKKLVLYNTRDICTVETTTETQSIFLGTDQYGNGLYEDMEVAVTARVVDAFDLADSMPDCTIKDFLIWLRNRFNLAYVISRDDRVKIIRRDELVLLPTAEDITSEVSGTPAVTSVEIPDGYLLSWDHDEDDILFNSEHFQRIDEHLALYAGSVANLTALAAISGPSLNEIRFVESVQLYYQYQYDEEESWYSWKVWSIAYQNYRIGNAKEQFHSGISTLQMVNYQRFGGGAFIRCPYTQQKSNGVERPAAIPFSPRVLLYQGLQLDSNEDPVPMGSVDNRDSDGNVITGATLTLLWEGEYGVYEQLWKNYLTWYNQRKQVTYILKDPSLLDFSQKYAIEGNHFLLKKRSIHFTMNSIEPGECEFYQV